MNYVAFDQYGSFYKIKKHPAKELKEQTGYSKASKMYMDTTDGESHHIGYICGPLWIEVFKITPAFDNSLTLA